MRLKVEYVPIDSINPYPGNAKLHPQEQIEQIKSSILEFGFNDPIGVWKNEVATGHGRLLAAKELEMKKVPIIRLDSLTDEQRQLRVCEIHIAICNKKLCRVCCRGRYGLVL